MDFKQLEMFVAVVEEGNFNRAAERVFRTQSAVSIALLKLEQEIGSPLLDRSSRNSHGLTEAGKILLDYARQLLQLRDQAMADLQRVRRMRSGCVRIGVQEGESLYWLTKTLPTFSERCPDIKVCVVRKPSTSLLHDLKLDKLDFALLTVPPSEKGLRTMIVGCDPITLIVSPKHKLARQPSTTIAALGAESVILCSPPPPWYEKLRAAFHQVGMPLHIKMEIEDLETVKNLVAENLGVAFLPRSCVEDDLRRGKLVSLPVADFTHKQPCWLVYCRLGWAASRAFLQALERPGMAVPKLGRSQKGRATCVAG